MKTFVVSGRVVRDIELKTGKSGKPYAQFSIAHNNGKDLNGVDVPPDYFECVAFDKQAENLVQYCGKKGDKVLISGYLKHERYTDESGKNRSAVKLTCTGVEFLNSKKMEGADEVPSELTKAPPESTPPESEIPF